MLVVPIQKDNIVTTDGARYRVVEYTNYKDSGPAVYARAQDSKTTVLVYFADIASINGTRVEFQSSAKVFNALGKIARDQHLPQPGDRVTFLINDFETGQEQEVSPRVRGLKLKSKSLGVNRGMFVLDADSHAHRIKFLIDIKRELGGSNFDRDAFLTYYKDYIGV